MTAKAKYELHAVQRTTQGKGASRRLRRTLDQIPAIIYGGKDPASLISLDQKKVMHALENQGYYSQLLTLFVDGNKEQVILKDIQRHPYKKAIAHMDFLRVKPTDTIVMRIPLHFLGGAEAPGVKQGGGIVNHRMNELEVRCQAQHLPAYIEVDISHLELDQTLHITDLKLPTGVESRDLSYGPEHNYPVVSVHLPRVQVEELETPVAAEGEAEAGAAATTGTAAAPGKDVKETKDQKEGDKKAKGK